MGNDEPEYRLGTLRGRRVVTWWENGKRRRYRFRAGISGPELKAAFARFVKGRERLITKSMVTCEELMQGYVRDREIDGKSSEKQRMSWRALAPVFGHLSPEHISKAECVAFKERRLNEGRSIGTVCTDLSVLRASLGWAVKHKKLQQAPHIFVPQPPPPKDRHLTRAEAEALLAEAKMFHLSLFIHLALATAGRHSALLELTWDRVDFIRKRIDLRTSEQARNKRRAVIPMTETVFRELKIAKQAALTDCVIEYAGSRIESVKTAFNKAAERAGMPDVTPHTLRHTAAVWMAEDGVSMSEISQYLGHTSTKITERVYARFSPDYLRRAARSLEMKSTPEAEQ